MWIYNRNQHYDFHVKKSSISEYIGNGKITKEAIKYYNVLLSPYLNQLNTANSNETIANLVSAIADCPALPNDQSYNNKNKIFECLIDSILYDRINRTDILGETYIINPWNLKEFVRTNQSARALLEPYQGNLFNQEGPVTFPVTVTLNNNSSDVEMSRDLFLGVMVVYRYLHLMHPLSYQGSKFHTEMKEVNTMSFENGQDVLSGYTVDVGGTRYKFNSLDFFQGLLTAASWNGLDPHTFITNLKQWSSDQTKIVATDLAY
jgi:hypothetical protein